VLDASGLPPEEAAYHCIAVPVTEIVANVGAFVTQKDWLADPVGGEVAPDTKATAAVFVPVVPFSKYVIFAVVAVFELVKITV
jgi:hypothetical protein